MERSPWPFFVRAGTEPSTMASLAWHQLPAALILDEAAPLVATSLPLMLSKLSHLNRDETSNSRLGLLMDWLFLRSYELLTTMRDVCWESLLCFAS